VLAVGCCCVLAVLLQCGKAGPESEASLPAGCISRCFAVRWLLPWMRWRQAVHWDRCGSGLLPQLLQILLLPGQELAALLQLKRCVVSAPGADSLHQLHETDDRSS